jgi:hypothetical protein
MRLFVLALALLAGAKVWTQDTLFRAGAEEALIAAYREHAIQACQKQTKTLDGAPARGSNWMRPASIRLATGSQTVKVYIWQVDHALWSSRFRNPYLVLSAGESSGGLSCEYDVLYGQATIGGH